MAKWAWAILGAIVLSACTGKDFAKPSAVSLTLGKTTPAEVIQQFGKPTQERTVMASPETPSLQPADAPLEPAGGTVTQFSYRHENRVGVAFVGMMAWPPPWKVAGFTFWNDKLVGYGFMSSFVKD